MVTWRKLSVSEIKLEHDVEFNLKSARKINYPEFKKLQLFHDAVKYSEIRVVDKSLDKKIRNRSRTTSKTQLLNLIKGYASYPKFRNEDTLENMYNGFKNGDVMPMPIVIENDGKYEIFSGNTRMDVSFQFGINPKVHWVKYK